MISYGATVRFQALYVFPVLAHERRRILHFGLTAHPTTGGPPGKLREAFPWETAPRYLLRDRERIFGAEFVTEMKAMGSQQVLSAPRSPWQRAYVERVIGRLCRECLDHVIVFSEAGLSRHLPKLRGLLSSKSHAAGLAEGDTRVRPDPTTRAGRITAEWSHSHNPFIAIRRTSLSYASAAVAET